MNESIDIQSFLGLLGNCTDSELSGYQVLLGWAGNIYRSRFAHAADTQEVRDKATELVHDFLLEKLPIISHHIMNNQGLFNKHQTARYVKVSLLNFYRSRWMRDLGLEERLNRQSDQVKHRYDTMRGSSPSSVDPVEELQDPDSITQYGNLNQDSVVEGLLCSRGNRAIYNLLEELSPQIKRYLFFVYSQSDHGLYASKSPSAARKEQSLARKALEAFLDRHELKYYEVYHFLRSMLGQRYLMELTRQYGTDYA